MLLLCDSWSAYYAEQGVPLLFIRLPGQARLPTPLPAAAGSWRRERALTINNINLFLQQIIAIL